MATRLQKSLFYSVVFGAAVMVIGCGRAPETPAKKEPVKPAVAPAAGAAHKEHPAEKADKLAGLAELSEADQAIAKKQKVCPVSGELLGEHGKPIKITVKGQVVFLCCPACEEPIKKDPYKYLAKLKKASAGK